MFLKTLQLVWPSLYHLDGLLLHIALTLNKSNLLLKFILMTCTEILLTVQLMISLIKKGN